jgi:SAM-dependent methyltransferase
MEDADLGELSAHYSRGEERDRLSAGRGLLEFIRTTSIILRYLPATPALVADIGGGPGRYALWLAGLGYRVEHRDLMPLHVRQLAADADGVAGLHTAVGDARELDLADASVDAVLLLGPLYHLRRRADRVRALAEARRVVARAAGHRPAPAGHGSGSGRVSHPEGLRGGQRKSRLGTAEATRSGRRAVATRLTAPPVRSIRP